MFRLLVLFSLILFSYVCAFQSQLISKITVHGAVSDIVYKNNLVYVATERGKVDILDLEKQKVVNSYSYPKFLDFMGEPQLPKVFSIDISPDGKYLIAVVQGNRGGREVYLVDIKGKGKPEKIISRKKHWQIGKVRFIDNDRVVFGLTGDEVLGYQISSKKELYRISVGMSFFSDMALDTDMRTLAVVDESGDTHIVDAVKGLLLRDIEEMNKDKAFSVDIKNKIVMTGGRDKKASIFNLKTNLKKEFHADDFMVFSVGLSPNGKLGAYVYNDRFDVAVVNIDLGERIGFLKGHEATPSKILFINERTLVIGCDNGKIYIWRIKP